MKKEGSDYTSWSDLKDILEGNRNMPLDANLESDDRLKREAANQITKFEQLERWNKLLHEDEISKEIMSRLDEVEKGNKKPEDEIRVHSKCFTLADWTIDEGLLYLWAKDGSKLLYIPEVERSKLVKRIHENPLTGHVSGPRLVKQLQKEVWWPGMEKDVPSEVKKCKKCLVANPSKR
ncbi:hypothetical protein PRIPAC_92333, partial [Pristionchus pacificus]|uniref:Integrase_H2C2 domain-containing protein n=1 Tax=Pristionchus pacificus TaxID=54126 RepID=A0A2A6CH82_PRIPA